MLADSFNQQGSDPPEDAVEATVINLRDDDLKLLVDLTVYQWLTSCVGTRGLDWWVKWSPYWDTPTALVIFRRPEDATVFTLKWMTRK